MAELKGITVEVVEGRGLAGRIVIEVDSNKEMTFDNTEPDPVWNQDFRFPVQEDSKVSFICLNGPVVLGSASLALQDLSLHESGPVETWLPVMQEEETVGELHVRIDGVFKGASPGLAEAFLVSLLRAEGLPNAGEYSAVIEIGKDLWQTTTQESSRNPEWHEVFPLIIRGEENVTFAIKDAQLSDSEVGICTIAGRDLILDIGREIALPLQGVDSDVGTLVVKVDFDDAAPNAGSGADANLLPLIVKVVCGEQLPSGDHLVAVLLYDKQIFQTRTQPSTGDVAFDEDFAFMVDPQGVIEVAVEGQDGLVGRADVPVEALLQVAESGKHLEVEIGDDGGVVQGLLILAAGRDTLSPQESPSPLEMEAEAAHAVGEVPAVAEEAPAEGIFEEEEDSGECAPLATSAIPINQAAVNAAAALTQEALAPVSAPAPVPAPAPAPVPLPSYAPQTTAAAESTTYEGTTLPVYSSYTSSQPTRYATTENGVTRHALPEPVISRRTLDGQVMSSLQGYSPHLLRSSQSISATTGQPLPTATVQSVPTPRIVPPVPATGFAHFVRHTLDGKVLTSNDGSSWELSGYAGSRTAVTSPGLVTYDASSTRTAPTVTTIVSSVAPLHTRARVLSGSPVATRQVVSGTPASPVAGTLMAPVTTEVTTTTIPTYVAPPLVSSPSAVTVTEQPMVRRVVVPQSNPIPTTIVGRTYTTAPAAVTSTVVESPVVIVPETTISPYPPRQLASPVTITSNSAAYTSPVTLRARDDDIRVVSIAPLGSSLRRSVPTYATEAPRVYAPAPALYSSGPMPRYSTIHSEVPMARGPIHPTTCSPDLDYKYGGRVINYSEREYYL